MDALQRPRARRRRLELDLSKAGTLRVEDLAVWLGVSVDSIYDRIDSGHIRTVRWGRVLLIPRCEADRLAAEGCP